MKHFTMRKNVDEFKFILQIMKINELLICKFSFSDNTNKNQLIKLQVLTSTTSLYFFRKNFITVSFKLSN